MPFCEEKTSSLKLLEDILKFFWGDASAVFHGAESGGSNPPSCVPEPNIFHKETPILFGGTWFSRSGDEWLVDMEGVIR